MAHAFDEITADSLRAAGWKKWNEHGQSTGAWIAEMDFGTAPAVQERLHQAATGLGLGYLTSAALGELQEALTSFAGARYGWQIDPQDVRPVPDVLTVMQAVVRHYSRAGSPIIVPTPAYMPFLSHPAAWDREVLQVPMAVSDGRYVYDLDALDAAFAAGGHMLVLCNPHNPVGRVLSVDELVAISEVVERHGGRVFADEIHAPLTYPGYRHVPYASVSDAAAEHTVTAMSASKAFNLPGLKCAQLVLSNDSDRQVWRRYGHVYEDQASTLGAVAATAAYTHGQPWLADVVAYLDDNRRELGALVAEHLPGVSYREPEGTYLAWLRTADAGIADPARFFRTRADVVAVGGEHCGEAGRGYLRFNFATPRPILVETIQRMGAALGA